MFLCAFSCRCSNFSLLHSLSLKLFSPVIRDEKVGNIGRHRRTKSLIQTAVNLSKLGPAPNFVQNTFLQSLFDIPCSIRFPYFSVFAYKRRFCSRKLQSEHATDRTISPATDFKIYSPGGRGGGWGASGHLTPNQFQIQILPPRVCSGVDWLSKTMDCSLAWCQVTAALPR